MDMTDHQHAREVVARVSSILNRAGVQASTTALAADLLKAKADGSTLGSRPIEELEKELTEITGAVHLSRWCADLRKSGIVDIDGYLPVLHALHTDPTVAAGARARLHPKKSSRISDSSSRAKSSPTGTDARSNTTSGLRLRESLALRESNATRDSLRREPKDEQRAATLQLRTQVRSAHHDSEVPDTQSTLDNSASEHRPSRTTDPLAQTTDQSAKDNLPQPVEAPKYSLQAEIERTQHTLQRATSTPQLRTSEPRTFRSGSITSSATAVRNRGDAPERDARVIWPSQSVSKEHADGQQVATLHGRDSLRNMRIGSSVAEERLETTPSIKGAGRVKDVDANERKAMDAQDRSHKAAIPAFEMENTSVADTTALDGTTLAQTSRTGVSFSQDLNATEVGSARRHPLRDSPLKARDAPRPKSQTVDRRQHLGSLPYTEQERLVLQDLLYVLLGIDGIYIQRVVTDDMLREGKRTMGPHLFKLESTMDSSIAELVKRIVKLADNYEVIEKFIESHSKFAYGRVVHALTAKMRSLLRNYTLLVVQLEHQALTVPDFGLQKLWFYVHPSLTTMSALASLVEAIRSVEMKAPKGKDTGGIPHCRGGLLLGVISERLIAFSGDPVIKALHEELLSASAIPYNIMLANWINNGEIHDPFNEFLIEERKPEKEHRGDDFTGAYWEGRYFLREDYVPSFLMPYKHKIILAGKYLNVIKECEAEIPDVEKRMSERKLDTRQPIGDVILALGGERFVESIEGAYRWSNRTLLSLLFRDRQLTECLRSIKRFFLLDQSDFITHFLDVAHEHLLLASHDVPITRVRALFELVLRNPGSTAASSKDYENVTVDFSSYPLMDALAQLQKAEDPQRRKPSSVGAHQNGIEAFQLEYTVKFPNSIVIKRRFIAKYQMLFRHMFSFRYIERQLADAWRNQIKSRLYDKGSRFRKRPALFLEDGEEDVALRAQDEAEALVMAKLCALRHRMLHFVQQFMHHMCYEVIEPGWEAFERDNEKAATIEELIEFHERFQDHCFRGCLLSDTKLIEVLETIKGVCRAFTAFSHSYCRYKSPYSPDTEGGYASHPSALPNSASERFDDEFFASTDATSKLKEYENQFLQHIRKMIDALTGLGATKSANFTSLAQRIDYNLYYQRIPTDLSSIVQVPMDIPGGLNDVDHLNI